MRAHAVPDLKPNPTYLTNFLGVLIDPKFFPQILAGKGGQLEPIPIPANWHADIAEWAAALRAVDLSGQALPLLNWAAGGDAGSTIPAWRRGVCLRRPISLESKAIEGTSNLRAKPAPPTDFQKSEVALYHGIAAAKDGIALFPRQETSGVQWGLEPVFDASLIERAKAKLAGTHEELPMISWKKLPRLIRALISCTSIFREGEADLIRDLLAILNKKVAYMTIGTHSREIEGKIFESLRAAGWLLEIERPAILSITNGVPQVTVDGVQGWRNGALLPMD